MKKQVLVVCMLLAATYAHAGIDQSVNKDMKIKQSQSQVGINKAVGQGNETSVSEGDTDVLSISIPATPSTQGKVEQSIGSPWGYLNKNQPSGGERIEWYSTFLSSLRDSGHITDEEYLKEVALMKKLAKKYVKGSTLSKIPVLGLLSN